MRNIADYRRILDVNKINGLLRYVSDSRVSNSILCGLKEKLKEKIKSFCNSNCVKHIRRNSPQYGVLMVEVGLEYVRDVMCDFIKEVGEEHIVCEKILFLNDFISRFENSVFLYREHKETLIKYESQNIFGIRFLLKNILNLVRGIEEGQKLRLIKEYCIKLDSGLAFICAGLSLIVKDVEILSRINTCAQVDSDQFFL
ncbi:MAG: hypothetical protein ACTJLM_01605 [Ehrlichia sp.]